MVSYYSYTTSSYLNNEYKRHLIFINQSKNSVQLTIGYLNYLLEKLWFNVVILKPTLISVKLQFKKQYENFNLT